LLRQTVRALPVAADYRMCRVRSRRPHPATAGRVRRADCALLLPSCRLRVLCREPPPPGWELPQRGLSRIFRLLPSQPAISEVPPTPRAHVAHTLALDLILAYKLVGPVFEHETFGELLRRARSSESKKNHSNN